MADIKWVKITTDIFTNRKTRQIEAMPEGDTMVLIWIKLICLAGQINDGGNIYLTEDIPYTPESLARELGRDAGVIHLALDTFSKFNMIDINENGVIHLTGWDEYQSVNGMERAKLKHRESQKRYRDKQKVKELEEGNPTRDITRDVTVTSPSYSYSPSPSISRSYSSSQSDSEADTVYTADITDTASKASHKTKKKESKKLYGEYKNVRLTDGEMEKLQEQFPDWMDRIDRLSEYIATKGDKYKNHLAVMRSWARRDTEKQDRASPIQVFRHERTHSEKVADMMAEAMELAAEEV